MDLTKFASQGKFLMLAIDHRGSLKKLLNTENEEEIINFKTDVIDSLGDQFSSILVDPKYGLPAYKNKAKPFILCIEKSGYEQEGEERITKLEYSVDQLKQWGAAGVKLVLQFNPHSTNNNFQIKTAKEVLAECQKFSLPLFLELVTYGEGKKQELVIDSVKAFLQEGVIPSVFKLEYPGDSDSCQNITTLVEKAPWILLTGGESFDIFKTQLQDAVTNGAVGFLAGRALWQEATSLQGEERRKFLGEVLRKRFEEISKITLAQ